MKFDIITDLISQNYEERQDSKIKLKKKNQIST